MWRTSKPIMLPYGGSHTYHFAIFNGGKFENREGVMDRTVNVSFRDRDSGKKCF